MGRVAVPVLLITGPLGVGKTTIAFEASTLLRRADVPHGLVDRDALSWCYPAPEDDPFRSRLAVRNLAAAWANYAAEGAKRLIFAGVVEGRSELSAYHEAIPGADICAVRLRASLETLRQRVLGREVGSDRDWCLSRALELAALMELQAVEDHLVETDGRTVTDVANEVLRRAGWC